MNSLLRTRLVGSLAVVLIHSTLAGDWPQWRGPNRDGKSTETGLLKQWPQGGPALVWKATGLGGGYATVALVGDRLYTAGDKADGNFVLALNRADGQPVWAAKLGKSGAPGWGGFAGPRVTPTVEGGRVYAVGQFGELGCFDAATGQEIWRKDYEKDFGSARPEWGFSGSPIIDGERVVVAPGGRGGTVVALDQKSGALVWRSQELTEGVHYSSLVRHELGGVRQFVLLTDKSLSGIAAADGKLLWTTPRKGNVAVIPDPICDGGQVYVTSGYGIGCHLFQIAAAAGQFTARQVYANKVMVNHHGGVVKVGGHLYGHSDSKGWTCQDFATGKEVWQAKGEGALDKGSLVYADGRLILREEKKGTGQVALLEAVPAGYQEKGRFTPPDQSGKENWPHPVVLDGRLYLRDQDTLLCYQLKP